MAKKVKIVKRKVQTPCPHCSKMVHPRQKVCPFCNKEIVRVPKAKKLGRLARRNSAAGMPEVTSEQALLYVLKSGGVSDARKTLEALRDNEAIAFAILSGGVDKALSMVDRVEKQMA